MGPELLCDVHQACTHAGVSVPRVDAAVGPPCWDPCRDFAANRPESMCHIYHEFIGYGPAAVSTLAS